MAATRRPPAGAVLETGEFDYAWNLQLGARRALAKMASKGKGQIVSAFGTLVERIMINLTNPDPALGDERSTAKHPHPFLSDIAVRRPCPWPSTATCWSKSATAMPAGRPATCCRHRKSTASTANDGCLKQDIEGAKELLDEAGWTVGGDGIRE